MHPYLPHLLSDIAEAHREDIPLEKEFPQNFEEHIEEVERFISGEEPENTKHTFGYYCGLKAIDFPPSDQFTGNEIKQVYEAFEKLLYSWNAGIDLPEKLPLPLRYEFMVNTLAEGFIVNNNGIMHFDYCSGYAPGCVFKEHCSCLEFWNDIPDEDENPLAPGEE